MCGYIGEWLDHCWLIGKVICLFSIYYATYLIFHVNSYPIQRNETSVWQLFEPHKRLHIGKNPFKCNVCVEKSYTVCFNKQNRRHCIGEKLVNYFFCDDKHSLYICIKLHRKQHTGDQLLNCPLCDNEDVSRIYFKHHMTHHTRKNLFICCKWNKKNHRIIYPVVHIKIPLEKDLYQLDFCILVILMNSKDTQIKCISCVKTFQLAIYLIPWPSQYWYIGKIIYFFSNFCVLYLIFFVTSCLEQIDSDCIWHYCVLHTRIHTGENLPLCTNCGVKSLIRYGKQHRKHLTEEILFKGSVCYIKSSQFNCNEHYRSPQTRDGLPRCPLCGNECVKGFYDEHHRRYHTLEDLDICFICVLKFFIANYLGNHVEIQVAIIYNILIRVEISNHDRP